MWQKTSHTACFFGAKAQHVISEVTPDVEILIVSSLGPKGRWYLNLLSLAYIELIYYHELYYFFQPYVYIHVHTTIHVSPLAVQYTYSNSSPGPCVVQGQTDPNNATGT